MNVKNQNLAGSTFDDICLIETTFNNGNLTKSRFENINLSGSHFHDINFTDVQFTAAQIGGTIFKHIGPPPDKTGKQARQRPVTFEEAMLNDSLFHKVDLSNVRIIDCTLTGMTIDGLLVTDLLAAYHKSRAGLAT